MVIKFDRFFLIGSSKQKRIKFHEISFFEIFKHPTVAKRLGDGLLWMSQNPAGLKLNPSLAHFLSQFCNHHVRIWESYAVMLCNNCHSILQILCLWASPFGITFFLGLTGDLVRRRFLTWSGILYDPYMIFSNDELYIILKRRNLRLNLEFRNLFFNIPYNIFLFNNIKNRILADLYIPRF